MPDGTCAVAGCDHAGKLKRGWCDKHYKRWLRNGDPLVAKKAANSAAPTYCTIPVCQRPHHARGLCKYHYGQQRRDGHIAAVCNHQRLDPAERFWAKVDVGHPLGCWNWIAQTDSGGYGRFSTDIDGRWYPVTAHRHAYELLIGPIPEGLQLDHLCRNTSCVNPDHLEPVTARENTRRGYGPAGTQARKTHCKRGHLLAGGNVHIRPDGARRCRECDKARHRVEVAP